MRLKQETRPNKKILPSQEPPIPHSPVCQHKEVSKELWLVLGEVEAVEAGVEELEEGGEGVQLGVVQPDPPLYALLHTRGQGAPEPGTPE